MTDRRAIQTRIQTSVGEVERGDIRSRERERGARARERERARARESERERERARERERELLSSNTFSTLFPPKNNIQPSRWDTLEWRLTCWKENSFKENVFYAKTTRRTAGIMLWLLIFSFWQMESWVRAWQETDLLRECGRKSSCVPELFMRLGENLPVYWQRWLLYECFMSADVWS